MKDKEIIEEIAQLIHNSLPDIYTTKLCEKGDCIADKVFDKPCWCVYKDIAEKIYDKLFPEASVVLSGKQCVEIVQDNYNIGYERGSKEMAEKLYNKVKKLYLENIGEQVFEHNWFGVQINKFAKQFGIEINNNNSFNIDEFNKGYAQGIKDLKNSKRC